MQVCINIYNVQHEVGRVFLHEQVLSAIPWNEQGIAQLSCMDEAIRTTAHMCRFGVTQQTVSGPTFATTATGFFTMCQSTSEEAHLVCIDVRDHGVFRGSSRTRQAHVYNPSLLLASGDGLAVQTQMGALGSFMFGATHVLPEAHAEDARERATQFQEDDFWMGAWDDAIDKSFKPDLEMARGDATECLKNMAVYIKVPIRSAHKLFANSLLWFGGWT